VSVREGATTPRFDFTVVGDANLDLMLYGVAEDQPTEQELLADRMALLLKRGASCATVYTATKCCSAPAQSSQIVDAVCAGDSFNAGFLHGWIRGWPLEEALLYGNFAGRWSTIASGGTTAFRGRDNSVDFHQVWRRSPSVSSH